MYEGRILKCKNKFRYYIFKYIYCFREKERKILNSKSKIIDYHLKRSERERIRGRG